MKGSTQPLSVSTNVEGATVYLDNMEIGVTPFTSEVVRGGEMLRVELEGYRTETIALSKSLEPMFWGNIIIGGTIGSIIDYVKGTAYQYAPAAYQIDLQAADQSDAHYQAQFAVRQFSILYADEISRDFSQGGGDYVSALVSLIDNFSEQEVDESVIKDAITNSRGDRVRFGNLIADLI
jgi:hypothetical protein